MDERKILITFSDTGGGHRCAAEAIKAAIDETVLTSSDHRHVKVIAETMIEGSNVLNTAFVELYNYLLRHHQSWVKYYINWIEIFKPNDNWLGYKLCRNAVKASLLRIKPEVVISVHPMVNHYTARALVELGLKEKCKLVIVVTDPNGQLWSGWSCLDADLTIVPNDLARDSLIELGSDKSHIRTIGMPIDPGSAPAYGSGFVV
ncbi:MAG: hypothetical protein HYX67_16450 [Candidatus Melainabacteria bacterium]|nr:hypothetical protein [Candidatus Melainabacteria bacterium]